MIHGVARNFEKPETLQARLNPQIWLRPTFKEVCPNGAMKWEQGLIERL